MVELGKYRSDCTLYKGALNSSVVVTLKYDSAPLCYYFRVDIETKNEGIATTNYALVSPKLNPIEEGAVDIHIDHICALTFDQFLGYDVLLSQEDEDFIRQGVRLLFYEYVLGVKGKKEV